MIIISDICIVLGGESVVGDGVGDKVFVGYWLLYHQINHQLLLRFVALESIRKMTDLYSDSKKKKLCKKKETLKII